MVNQLYIVMSFFISGLLIGLIFDIFRVTRKAFRLPNIIIYIEDILFGIITGLIVVSTICICTDGQIRLYMILMIVTGTLFYFLLISRYFMKVNVKILDILKIVIKKSIKPFKVIEIFLKNNIKSKKNLKK